MKHIKYVMSIWIVSLVVGSLSLSFFLGIRSGDIISVLVFPIGLFCAGFLSLVPIIVFGCVYCLFQYYYNAFYNNKRIIATTLTCLFACSCLLLFLEDPDFDDSFHFPIPYILSAILTAWFVYPKIYGKVEENLDEVK